MKELNSDGYVVCQIGGPIYAVAQTREMAIAHYYEDCGDDATVPVEYHERRASYMPIVIIEATAELLLAAEDGLDCYNYDILDGIAHLPWETEEEFAEDMEISF